LKDRTTKKGESWADLNKRRGRLAARLLVIEGRQAVPENITTGNGVTMNG
jgi:hypothetical protein